jgi:hypothetical protein
LVDASTQSVIGHSINGVSVTSHQATARLTGRWFNLRLALCRPRQHLLRSALAVVTTIPEKRKTACRSHENGGRLLLERDPAHDSAALID